MQKIDTSYLNFLEKPEFNDILTNPILDIAARFWENDRYDAFKVCYRSMRIIDDLVDGQKAGGHTLTNIEKKQIEDIIRNWTDDFSNGKRTDNFQTALLDIKDRFKIPLWPWMRLSKAMIYDLYHNDFTSFLVFLRYSEGAAISPASIFMHLIGVSQNDAGYSVPKYDIRLAARHLALFSYIVHIMRDFQKDQLEGLNYYALNQLEIFNVKKEDLKNAAESGELSDNVRKLFKTYYNFASYYRTKARKTIDSVLPLLAPRYQLSLEIIYSLYNQIYMRIDVSNGNFSESELLPTASDVKSQIDNTVAEFNKKN